MCTLWYWTLHVFVTCYDNLLIGNLLWSVVKAVSVCFDLDCTTVTVHLPLCVTICYYKSVTYICCTFTSDLLSWPSLDPDQLDDTNKQNYQQGPPPQGYYQQGPPQGYYQQQPQPMYVQQQPQQQRGGGCCSAFCGTCCAILCCCCAEDCLEMMC